MATRRETVRIELDDAFTTPMARAAAAAAAYEMQLDRLNRVRIDINVDDSQVTAAQVQAAALRAELDRLNRTRVNTSVTQTYTQITRGNQQATSAVRRTNSALDAQGNSIDRLSGRVGLAVDAILTLGPAMIPVGAVAMTALGGIATAATAAGTAALSAVVAFQGVGDAISAIDAYRLDPTAASLEKAQEAMRELSPSARRFVDDFQDFKPTLDLLQRSAADGWFPGLSDSLDDLERVGPKIAAILERTGEAGGDAVARAADSLDSDRWENFLDYLEVEMPSAVASLSRIFGDLAHGTAELWMSLDPGNDRFLAWLEDVASAFDEWADSPEGRESVERFLAYAHTNGPAVRELFNSLAQTFGALIDAGADFGGPLLDGLNAVLNVVEAIAESDMAGPLLAAAAAMRLLNRATTAAQSSFVTGLLAPWRAIPTPTPGGPAIPPGIPAHLRHLYGAPRPQDLRAQQQTARRMQIAQGGALAAGVGFLASGASEELGLTNTAMLTMAGTMAGPWGAAAGAAAGLALDFAAANNEVETAVERAQAAIDAGDFTTMRAGLAATRSEIDKLRTDSEDGGFFQNYAPASGLAGIAGAMDWWKGEEADEAEEQLASLERQVKLNDEAAAGLAESLGMTVGPLDGSARSIEELESALRRAEPAMTKLNLTQEDLVRLRREQDAIARNASGEGGLFDYLTAEGASSLTPYDDALRRINFSLRQADSNAGRMSNLTEVITNSGEVMLSTADSADALKLALDNLLSPQMGLTAATDAWTTSLRTLKEDLADNRTLVGDSNAAIQNRGAIQQRITDLQNLLVSERNAGAGPRRLSEVLREGRRDLIDFAAELNVTRPQLHDFLNGQGLSADMIAQVMRGVRTEAQKTRREVVGIYDELPRNVQTVITTSGIPKSKKEARELADDLDLAGKDRKTLMQLVDLASGKARQIDALLDQLERDRSSTITITERRFYESVRRNNMIVDSADGNFLTFARGGDLPGAHAPEFAGPGPIRVWREPETGGESYIPHANDHRRPRAKRIVEQTADLFGGHVQWFAAGGARLASQTYGHSSQPLRARAGAGDGRLAVDLGDVRVEGTLRTPWGPAEVRGIARATAQEEINRAREFEETHVV